MSHCLTRRLLEAALIIGADQHTGLKAWSGASRTEPILPEDRTYEANVLATISESRACFHFTNTTTEQFPPSKPTVNKSLLSIAENEDGDSGEFPSLPSLGKRRFSTRPGALRMSLLNEEQLLNYTKNLRHGRRTSAAHTRLNLSGYSLSSDTIKGLPHICFPKGMKIQSHELEDHIHFIVITDAYGNRLYGVSVIMHKACRLVRDQDDVIHYHSPLAEQNGGGYSDPFDAYLPYSILLISKVPYFTVLKQAMSRLVTELKSNDEDGDKLIAQFTFDLCSVPLPPPGVKGLSINLLGVNLLIVPPLPLINRVVDFDLTLIFNCLHFEYVVDVLCALLTEGRVILLSDCMSFVALTMETLMLLFAPFTWKYPYVPCLPPNALELLEAPGPYFFGCHASFKNNVLNAENVLMVDLDKGKLTHTEVDMNVLIPPEQPKKNLELSLQEVCYSFDKFMSSRIEPGTLDELNVLNAAYRNANQRLIVYGFLTFMVETFSGILRFIKVTKAAQIFNRDGFLATCGSDRPFYQAVLETEIFDEFLRDRMNGKQDAWSHLEEQTLVERPTDVTRKISSRSAPVLLRRKQSADFMFPLFRRSHSCGSPEYDIATLNSSIVLPRITLSTSQPFLFRLLYFLDTKCDSCENQTEKASYLYLRSDVYLALGHKADYLRDIYSLTKTDMNLVSVNTLQNVIATLTPTERSMCVKSDFFEQLLKLVELKTESILVEGSITKSFVLPHNDSDRGTFCELLETADVTSNSAVAGRLFTVMSGVIKGEKKLYVGSEDFALMMEYWNETLSDVAINFAELPEGEIVLRVTSNIRIDPGGMGRVVLTQNRLVIMPQGGTTIKLIALLKNIRHINKETTWYMGNMHTLSILVDNQAKPIILWLKEYTDDFYTLIYEMWCAKSIVRETKDVGIVQEAIDNVLVISAMQNCMKEEMFLFGNYRKCIDALLYFTNIFTNKKYVLSEESKLSMQYKFNPTRNKKLFDIDAILYIYDDTDSRNKPKIWCAYNGDGLGTIVILDGGSFAIESELYSSNIRINGMLLVSKKEVWASFNDQKIRVFDQGTRLCNNVLLEHKDNVTCWEAATHTGKSIIACGTTSGSIIIWDTDTKNIDIHWNVCNNADASQIMCLSVSNEKLYVLLSQYLRVYSLTGEMHSVIENPTENGFLHMAITSSRIYVAIKCQPTVLILNLENEIKIYDQFKIDSQCDTHLRETETTGYCSGVKRIISIDRYLWLCCAKGNIHIYSRKRNAVMYTLQGHSDEIQSVCKAKNTIVLTGGACGDGKIAVWNRNFFTSA